MASAGALLLALALGAEAQLDAGVRLEAAARSAQPPPVPGEDEAIDLTAMPRLALQVTAGAAALSADYSPRFAVLAVGDDARSEQLHAGTLRLALARGPAFRLEAIADGAAGRSDLVTENRRTSGESVTTPVLSTQQIDLERWRGGLALSLAPSRRTALLLGGARSQDGGTNATSREVYPVARTWEGSAEVRWSATRLDRLGVLATGAQARIHSLRADSGWVSALATWRRRLAPRTETWAGAGAVLLSSRVPEAEVGTPRRTRSSLEPAAQLGLGLTAVTPTDASGELSAALGASVDRQTGEATPRAEAAVTLRWPWTPVVAFTCRGSGALAWPETGRTRVGLLTAGLSFALHPRVRVDVGGYGSWQRSPDPALPPVDSYAATLTLSAEAPPARF